MYLQMQRYFELQMYLYLSKCICRHVFKMGVLCPMGVALRSTTIKAKTNSLGFVYTHLVSYA